jgi:hypothetical protein
MCPRNTGSHYTIPFPWVPPCYTKAERTQPHDMPLFDTYDTSSFKRLLQSMENSSYLKTRELKIFSTYLC